MTVKPLSTAEHCPSHNVTVCHRGRSGMSDTWIMKMLKTSASRLLLTRWRGKDEVCPGHSQSQNCSSFGCEFNISFTNSRCANYWLVTMQQCAWNGMKCTCSRTDNPLYFLSFCTFSPRLHVVRKYMFNSFPEFLNYGQILYIWKWLNLKTKINQN